MTYRHKTRGLDVWRRIDREDGGEVIALASRLECTVAELHDAIGTVGPIVGDVHNYLMRLKGVHRHWPALGQTR
jgi:hypothetical protein